MAPLFQKQKNIIKGKLITRIRSFFLGEITLRKKSGTRRNNNNKEKKKKRSNDDEALFPGIRILFLFSSSSLIS